MRIFRTIADAAALPPAVRRTACGRRRARGRGGARRPAAITVDETVVYRAGFDRSPIGMTLIEPASGRYVRVNDAFCRLLGREREELLRLKPADITHPDDLAAHAALRRRNLVERPSEQQFEKRYVRGDGSCVWALVHLVAVRDGDGDVRAVLSQVVDLTAAKEREARLVGEAGEMTRLAELRAAVAAGRLIVHAQPILDLGSGAIVQQELLVRLLDESGAILPPGQFLPLAERHGYIAEIDQWVIRQAVALAAGGQPVEVNLSATSVEDQGTLHTIRDALAESGADPALLVFEVTETALMADLEAGRRFAVALRNLGCRFALDDFGTGYGTFTYLKHIPIDFVKIDAEFVRELLVNPADDRLVRVIVGMAHQLGKQTIAEGVEDAETLRRLRDLGVDHAQGFHIGRPVALAA